MISFLLLLASRVSASGGLLIPLYVWPTIDGTNCISEDYKKIATSAAAAQTIAIVNPYNGPDYSGDVWKKLSYDTCIQYLRDAGVEVIGYVHTKVGYPHISGYRDLEDIKADIDMWKEEYKIDGIFIDEVTGRWMDDWDSEAQVLSVNKHLVDYVLSSYDRAVMNPGGPYFEELMEPYHGNPKVIAVVFENKQWDFQRGNCLWGLWSTDKGSFKQGPWCPYVPEWDDVEPLKAVMDSGEILPEQSAALVYGATDAASAARTVELAQAARVGWVFVTDVWGWNPMPSQAVMDAQAEAVKD